MKRTLNVFFDKKLLKQYIKADKEYDKNQQKKAIYGHLNLQAKKKSVNKL